jgi:hypothetical protein
MYLTISERVYAMICNPGSRILVITPTGTEDATAERELVRQALTRQLATDWPPYMQSVLDRMRSEGA